MNRENLLNPNAQWADPEGGKVNDAGYYPGQKVIDCDKAIRLGFIRKVYGILSAQLLATILVCAGAMTITGGQTVGSYGVLSIGSFLAGSRAFSFTVFIFTFVILIALACYKDSYPMNHFLLTVWTLLLSFTVATACVMVQCDPMVETAKGVVVPLSMTSGGSAVLYHGSIYCAVGTEQYIRGTNAVLIALGITAALFVGLTLFTLQSKWDFSFLGASLFVALWALILWGFVMMIFGGGPQVQYFYSLAAAIIFSLYIVFDTWQVTCKYGPDDYIIGAIDLYLDVLNLFLAILRLVADRRD